MALIKPGHFPTTHFPSGHWQEDHWPEYGVVAPPVAPTEVPVGFVRRKEFPETIEDYGLLIMLISSLRRRRQNGDDNR